MTVHPEDLTHAQVAAEAPARPLSVLSRRREGAQLPDFNPSNPKLAVPRKVWSHLPGFMARGLSGPLSRYLP